MCSSSIESSKSSRTFSQNGRNPSTRSKIRRIESWEDFLLVTVQHPSLRLWKKKKRCNTDFNRLKKLVSRDQYSSSFLPSIITICFLAPTYFPRSSSSSIFLPDDILRFDASRTIRSVERIRWINADRCRGSLLSFSCNIRHRRYVDVKKDAIISFVLNC